jgi:hypothetical protein
VKPSVGRFPVDLRLEDDFRRVAMTEGNNLVDMTEEGPAEHAGGEHGPVDAVVDGSAGALDRVEGLVVGHVEFVDDFIPRVDLHYATKQMKVLMKVKSEL